MRRFRSAPFTLGVLAVCWILFALNFLLSGASPQSQPFGPVVVWGAIAPDAVAAGQWYRLVTAGFIHFTLTHIAFNSYALFQAGMFLEYAYGTARFAVIYVVALFAGDLAAYMTTTGTQALTAGASGAIMGVFGAMAALGLKLPPLRRPLLESALVPIVLTLGYGFTNPNISNAGHIGGLIAGAIVGFAIPAANVGQFVTAEKEEEEEQEEVVDT